MSRPEIVSSPANPLIRDLRRAISRGELTSGGFCVAEGFHLLEEALRSDCEISVVLVAAAVKSTIERHIAGLHGPRMIVLTDALFQSIAATEATRGVIALVRPPEWSMEQLFRGQSMVIVLDGLQDPGNAGSIVRAAEAFGATGVLFIKGTVSPMNPKTLRASAGSLFRVPFMANVDAQLASAALRHHRLDVYAAMPFTGSERGVDDVDFCRRSALVIGSEGRGIGKELYGIAENIAIPTVGVESLNAAVAASVLLYEARRQRVREAVRA